MRHLHDSNIGVAPSGFRPGSSEQRHDLPRARLLTSSVLGVGPGAYPPNEVLPMPTRSEEPITTSSKRGAAEGSAAAPGCEHGGARGHGDGTGTAEDSGEVGAYNVCSVLRPGLPA